MYTYKQTVGKKTNPNTNSNHRRLAQIDKISIGALSTLAI